MLSKLSVSFWIWICIAVKSEEIFLVNTLLAVLEVSDRMLCKSKQEFCQCLSHVAYVGVYKVSLWYSLDT